MTEMINTKQAIERFKEETCEKLQRFYLAGECRTVEALKELMDKEEGFLLPLRHEVTSSLRKICYQGMRQDGVEHPEIAWAQHVGTKYSACYLPTIRSEAVQEEVHSARREALEAQRAAQETQRPAAGLGGGPSQNGMLIGGGTALAGVACVVGGCIMTPISVALIMLGIAATAGGTLVIIRQTGQQGASRRSAAPGGAAAHRPAPQVDESRVVRKILEDQIVRCRQELDAYCRTAYGYACDAAEKAGERAQ